MANDRVMMFVGKVNFIFISTVWNAVRNSCLLSIIQISDSFTALYAVLVGSGFLKLIRKRKSICNRFCCIFCFNTNLNRIVTIDSLEGRK